MANYSTDADLIVIRPKIADLGITDLSPYHTEAKNRIDRVLEQRWYRPEATNRGILYTETAFDADLLNADQLKYLACYKALELIYEALMKDSAEADGFERQMLRYQAKFDDELQSLLTLGVDYDWDADDTFDEDERIRPVFRRLRRT
jgi:hypothetical protein